MQEKIGSVKPEGHAAFLRRVKRDARRQQKATQGTAHDDAQAAAGVGSAERLGNLTESQAGIRTVIDEKTLEIQEFRFDKVRREYVQERDGDLYSLIARKARYAAQGTAAVLLGESRTPRGTPWRVIGCARRRIGEEVAVMHSPTLKRAHFAGLMICGSVWTCPPCAAKVSERRKQEIVKATNLHKDCGGHLYMITHTFSHQRADELAPMLARFAKARKYMREQRAYKELRRTMAYIGDIRTLEVTYGDASGFHPHEHDLWLVADRLTDRQQRTLRSTLFTLWHKACKVAGLGVPNRKNGVNVIEAESAAEYMAKFGHEPKWGIASELTKQHVKSGKVKSMTAFDLLRAAHDGAARFGSLFVEFASAFFGKRQVVWSDGLKKLFGLDEITDEEIASKESEDATVVIRLTASEWRAVLARPYDERSVILELAEAGGFVAVRRYLDALASGSGPVWKIKLDS